MLHCPQSQALLHRHCHHQVLVGILANLRHNLIHIRCELIKYHHPICLQTTTEAEGKIRPTIIVTMNHVRQIPTDGATIHTLGEKVLNRGGLLLIVTSSGLQGHHLYVALSTNTVGDIRGRGKKAIEQEDSRQLSAEMVAGGEQVQETITQWIRGKRRIIGVRVCQT